MRRESIRPQFVEHIPRNLDEGILYISREFETASHLCCCGCGTKIVTPLIETEYELREIEGQVSIYPSIGNWNLPCRSHYWIRNNRVDWSYQMTDEQIRRGRTRDDALRDAYFQNKHSSWWKRLSNLLSRFYS